MNNILFIIKVKSRVSLNDHIGAPPFMLTIQSIIVIMFGSMQFNVV